MTPVRRSAAVALLAAIGIVAGAASSLVATSGSLGAARTATPRCTATGLSVLENLSGASVASVTVGVLPAACQGATLQVTVNSGVSSGSGSAVVPGGGGSVTVTLGVAPAVTATAETDLVLVGP